MLFDGIDDLVRILVVGVSAYAGLILLLRVTGKRTLSKMNAFDFVVTVALGSTLASALLSSEVTLSEAFLAFALLCGLQYAVTFASVRSGVIQRVVKAEPRLLYFRGTYLSRALRHERVTQEEILAAVRAQGKGELARVDAVVLETDGTFSVLSGAGDRPLDALSTVDRPAGEAGIGGPAS
ncbi:MAG: DUF421 domain-containing protein [Alphaproteobacteria bacterium]|nr:DUF421 domain-containing protein [Alphaproteobacteria bacterium]